MWEERNNIIYLHGRPSAHPLHKAFARSVTNQFDYIDSPIRWQDKNYNPIVLVLIWIINALLFKYKSKRTVFLIDNLHISPIIYKKLFLKKSIKQKFILHLGSHTLYFIKNKKFNYFNELLHKWALRNYDVLLCEGKMAKELVVDILGSNSPPVYTTFLGPLTERINSLSKIEPKISSNRILIIASGPTKFRMEYKGLDLMIKSFGRFNKENQNNYFLDIIGLWEVDVINYCYNLLDPFEKSFVYFHGAQDDIERFIKEAAIGLHVSRGDAFPTATIECMAAGLPVMVSAETGTKEIVEKINSNLIVDCKEESVVKGLNWFFNLTSEEKIFISYCCKAESSSYSEENAVNFYKEVFKKILEP